MGKGLLLLALGFWDCVVRGNDTRKNIDLLGLVATTFSCFYSDKERTTYICFHSFFYFVNTEYNDIPFDTTTS